MTEVKQQETEKEMSEDEAIMKIATAMKDTPTPDEKHNVHTFLDNVIRTEGILKVSKLGFLRDDKDINELGVPLWNVRGCLEMARISDKIMDNPFFQNFFEASASETLVTSLSREGFLIRQGTTKTTQVADVTKRRKINKGWFGKEKVEESGGDTIQNERR